MDAQTILDSLNNEENIKIKAYRSENWEDFVRYGEVYYSPYEYADGFLKSTILNIPIENIETEGGREGEGEYTHIVIKVGEFYFKITGYYSSWEGSNFDTPWTQVWPTEVTKIEYL